MRSRAQDRHVKEGFRLPDSGTDRAVPTTGPWLDQSFHWTALEKLNQWLNKLL